MAGELTPEGLRATAEADRAVLLDLLRTVARVVFAREDLDKSTCEVCGGRGLCVADCPAGLLGALREGA
jgi:ferredoxin